MQTIRLDKTDREMITLIEHEAQVLQIPDYLDTDEVNEVLEDAVILWQSDNEHNFCVLAAWPDKEQPFHTMFYFSRFFAVGGKTLVSHDATGQNFFKMLIKLAEQANRYFEK